MNRGSGFTLIELIVTIAIAGVLLALAIPSFRETTLNNQRAARTNELITDLIYARSQAVGLRQQVRVCRTDAPAATPPACPAGDGWEEGWVVVATGPDGAFDTGDDQILRRHDALLPAAQLDMDDDDKFTIRGSGTPADSVTFQPGGTTTSLGTLYACDARDEAKGRGIVISSGGRTRFDNTITTCQR